MDRTGLADYELKYQAVRFLNGFLIYETVNVPDTCNLPFLLKHVKFQQVA